MLIKCKSDGKYSLVNFDNVSWIWIGNGEIMAQENGEVHKKTVYYLRAVFNDAGDDSYVYLTPFICGKEKEGHGPGTAIDLLNGLMEMLYDYAEAKQATCDISRISDNWRTVDKYMAVKWRILT